MDLIQTLKLAESLNYQLVNHEATDGFYTYFVKDDEVKGLVKANGAGWSYQLPEDMNVILGNLQTIHLKAAEAKQKRGA